MRCLSRRIADGRLLRIIKGWLTVPVVERAGRRVTRTATARRTKRGTPQGSVISPMLANLYFRRFLLAWRNHGHQDQLDAHVVNYADDFVICCRPGNAEMAKTRMTALMTRLGLEVNETKTRLARIPGDNITFLGYTLGQFHGMGGRPYTGTRPSRKAVKSLLKRIHERTARRSYADTHENTVGDLSRLRRHHLLAGAHRRQRTLGVKPPPAEQLVRCNAMPARHQRHRHPRRVGLLHDCCLLFRRPAPPPLNRRNHLNSIDRPSHRHRHTPGA